LLAERPSDPALCQLAAAVALRSGDARQAKSWADVAIQLQPGHAPTLLVAGHAARATGDRKAASDYFREAMRFAPERAEAAFMACVSLLEAEDQAAQALLDHCLEAFPDDAPGWTNIGLALQRAGQPEAALVAMQRALRASASAQRCMICAALLLELRRPQEAVEALRAADALEPGFETAFELGRALRERGDGEKARRALERAVAYAPQSGKAWFALGLVAQDARDWPAAVAAYRRALEAEPAFAEAAVNLGSALQETGDLESARSAYRDAIRVRPETFGRIAQSLAAAPSGEVWLDLAALRQSLEA
jgi:tetratricopeptide (TPR) repeat protein